MTHVHMHRDPARLHEPCVWSGLLTGSLQLGAVRSMRNIAGNRKAQTKVGICVCLISWFCTQVWKKVWWALCVFDKFILYTSWHKYVMRVLCLSDS